MTATADWVVKFGNIILNHVLGWIEALNGRLIGPKT